MSQDTRPEPVPPRNGVGTWAFVVGVVGFVFALVPIVGEFVAIPAAVLAIVLGLVGFERAEKGIATNRSQALTGIVLGVMAGFVVFLVFAATLMPTT